MRHAEVPKDALQQEVTSALTSDKIWLPKGFCKACFTFCLLAKMGGMSAGCPHQYRGPQRELKDLRPASSTLREAAFTTARSAKSGAP